jgi:hypothetical protein
MIDDPKGLDKQDEHRFDYFFIHIGGRQFVKTLKEPDYSNGYAAQGPLLSS